MQSNNYWSSTEYADNPNNAWNLNMNDGNVNNNNKDNNNYVWPVRPDNDVLRMFLFENIYRPYLQCRRNKRSTVNALKFVMNCQENLIDLHSEPADRTYDYETLDTLRATLESYLGDYKWTGIPGCR